MDWYDEDYYRNAPAINPPGPPDGELKVQRGGWTLSFRYARVANRRKSNPGFACLSRRRVSMRMSQLKIPY